MRQAIKGTWQDVNGHLALTFTLNLQLWRFFLT